MPTTYRGSFTILNGDDTNRHGFGDLILPQGVINSSGRLNQPQNIATLGTGTITLQTVDGDITLNTTATGNVNINSAGNFTASKTSTYSIGANGATGNINIASSGGSDRSIMIQTNGTTPGSTGSITIQNLQGATNGVISLYNAKVNDQILPLLPTVTGISINTGGSKIAIGATSDLIELSSTGKIVDVKGDLKVTGDLTVQGITTTIDSVTLTVDDNIIVLNSNSSTAIDSGILSKRFQIINTTGSGAIVNSNNVTTTGIAQAPYVDTTKINLQNANPTDGYYTGGWIKITGGAGAGLVREILDYTGAGFVCEVEDYGGFIAALNNTSTYAVYLDKLYTGLIYNETESTWAIAGTKSDPVAGGNVPDLSYEDLKVRNLVVTGEISGSTTGFTTATLSTMGEGAANPTSVPGFNKTRGTGTIIVTGQTAGSACATFMISKSVAGEVAQVQRVTSSSSSLNGGDLTATTFAEIDVRWLANATAPEVFHSAVSNSATPVSVIYNIAYLVL